ncbi:MAG: hypothetical protein ABIS51_03475 [Sphingomonas sp.]
MQLDIADCGIDHERRAGYLRIRWWSFCPVQFDVCVIFRPVRTRVFGRPTMHDEGDADEGV